MNLEFSPAFGAWDRRSSVNPLLMRALRTVDAIPAIDTGAILAYFFIGTHCVMKLIMPWPSVPST